MSLHAFLRHRPFRWAFSSTGAALIKARFPRNQAAMIACPADSAPLAALLQQVREEYGKMPGLKLTKPKAMRLFGVAPSVSAAMLRALVMENFLSRAGDGVFVRSTTDVKTHGAVTLQTRW